MPRLRCGMGDALRPAFTLAWRLDGPSLPGWDRLGGCRFASAMTGGRLIGASTVSPWYLRLAAVTY